MPCVLCTVIIHVPKLPFTGVIVCSVAISASRTMALEVNGRANSTPNANNKMTQVSSETLLLSGGVIASYLFWKTNQKTERRRNHLNPILSQAAANMDDGKSDPSGHAHQHVGDLFEQFISAPVNVVDILTDRIAESNFFASSRGNKRRGIALSGEPSLGVTDVQRP